MSKTDETESNEAASGSVKPLGSLWEIKTADHVDVQRPDGTQVKVASDGTTAGHTLDVAGEYVATVGGKQHTVEAG